MNVFTQLQQHLKEAGTLTPVCVSAGHPLSAWTPATEDAIITAMEWEPLRSLCTTARELGLSRAFVLNIIHDDELHTHFYLQNQHQNLWKLFMSWAERIQCLDLITRNVRKFCFHGRELFKQLHWTLGDGYAVTSLFEPSVVSANLVGDLRTLSKVLTEADHVVIVGRSGSSPERDQFPVWEGLG